ncbi:hypothetical protein EXIGLDRAFT_772555 [Exidia glandulosa HHB12029]|uniref:Uncharacterized protein n=1 Tax=Exidia glandulosa HHB12029 TaxID=1314781 RepID=A0A165F8M7_EXIGL|nr:hypothetical protein EXIGLDRAFT_772555 [Exidia glandulosa HHB12029]
MSNRIPTYSASYRSLAHRENTGGPDMAPSSRILLFMPFWAAILTFAVGEATGLQPSLPHPIGAATPVANRS